MCRKLLCVAILAVLATPLCQAGTLRVGVPQIEGNQVVLPVLLEGNAAGGVAALDFTLNYDPAVFTPVGAEASVAAQAARKQVESNEVSPGNYVVMMFGMNQTTVEDGQVASITLNKRAQPASNQTDVSIEETTFASVEGSEIASEGSSQTVTFPPPPSDDGGSETPPPTDETPPVEPPATLPPTQPTEPSASPTQPTAPTAPGVPGGAPLQGNPPSQNAPRAMPTIPASSTLGNSAVNDSATNGVARMNRAAQRLEISRAAISQSTHTDGASSSPDPEGETEDNSDAPLSPSEEAASGDDTDESLQVASVPATPGSISGAAGRVPDAGRLGAPDGSGIPPASRRILIVVGTVIAVSLIVYRFARKSAR